MNFWYEHNSPVLDICDLETAPREGGLRVGLGISDTPHGVGGVDACPLDAGICC